MIITKEWYEKAKAWKKQADDYNLSTLERHKAEESFFATLQELQVQEIAAKPKEELQHLPFPAVFEVLLYSFHTIPRDSVPPSRDEDSTPDRRRLPV